MGHGAVQEGVAQKELNLAEYLRIRPVGYDTIISHAPRLLRRIHDLKFLEARARMMRQDLEAFMGPYLCYEKLLNNGLSQTVTKMEGE